jgi:murein DD-endopeptidase MepM/ murein hydrolase activator NlpD
MLYTDGIGAGFTAHNHWGVTWNDVTGWGGTGDKDLAVDFEQLLGYWSTIRIQTERELWSAEFGHLTFTVRSGLGGNLYPYLRDADGTSITPVSTTADYILEGSVQLAERTVSIPMSNLLSNGHTLLSGVLFDSDRKGIVYLDDIQLEPPTPGLFTLFDDHLHVQVNRWGNTQLSTTFSEPFAGQNAIRAEFPMAWEGFSLRQTQRVSTDEFGALTFAVKGNQSGQNLLVYAIDEDEDIVGTAVWASDYIHGGVLPTDWQVAWIPLRDLMPGGGDFNGIAVEPSVAGTVWLDEVKVVEGFKLPLSGGKNWKATTSAGGSATHSEDTNYYSLDFAARTLEDDEGNTQLSNVPIIAAAGGKVVEVGYSATGNGHYIRIDHDYDGNVNTGITTHYLHLKERPLVGEGATVSQGQQIGIMGTTGYSSGIHLHFQFKSEGMSTKEGAAMLRFVELEGIQIEDYQAGSFYPSSNLVVQ